ncbi:MAG: LytR/AlgR family response regulator transcription factor [Calditrichaceae bacterium]
MLKAVIIDDEEKSRLLLRNLIHDHCPNVEILALAESVESGLEAVRLNHPDVVFLDIVMPPGDGFSLLENAGDLNFNVIFTTAYDQYAIKAIKFGADDYLLKPINIEDLQTAVNKLEQKLTINNSETEIETKIEGLVELANIRAANRKIGLPMQNGITFIKIRDIVLFKAEGNYCLVYQKETSEKEIVSKTLREYENLLTRFNFFRVHRSYLINLAHIKEYSRIGHSANYEGDGGSVIMMNNMIVPVARERRKPLLNRFSKPF